MKRTWGRGVGLTINANMKVSEQCKIAASKVRVVPRSMLRRKIEGMWSNNTGDANIDPNIFVKIKP